MTKKTKWSLFALGLVVAAVTCLGVLAGIKPDREPFRGVHQAGIATAPQKFAFVVAFDVTTNAEGIKALLKLWTRASESLTQGTPLEAVSQGAVPSADTGEVLGYKPSRLTLTFGVGPSLFDGRFGLTSRPEALAPLPAFPGDRLDPTISDGDLVVQAAADDLQTAYHAVHTLTRLAQGRAVARWVQQGFQPGLEVNPQGPGRNLEGFLDGIVNPDVTKPTDLDKVVWVDQGPSWMQGGAYLVVRRIRMFVETWDRSSLGDQEKTIGRDRATGHELPTLAEDSHVRVARGAGVEKILRRPFSYVNGLDGRTGQWDSGLLFLAWMKDPVRQYVPMQARISTMDGLNEYIRPVGSAVFAVFPGVSAGSYLGAGLFPDASAVSRIEALQAQLGALYPALAREDWATLRTGAADFVAQYEGDKDLAAGRASNLDHLTEAWSTALASEHPGAPVRAAQSALARALDQWRQAEAPKVAGGVLGLSGLKTRLAEVGIALTTNQPSKAKDSLVAFQREWLAQESLVRNLDSGVYSRVEMQTGALRRALETAPPGPSAMVAFHDMDQALTALRAPAAFTAWDAGFLLFREGLEALLVLAALLAFLGRTNQNHRPWVWSGAGAGLAASIAVAAVVSLVMTGWSASAPNFVEGLTGLAAVALMLTVGAWFHSKASVKNWNLWWKGKIGQAENPWALASLAFLAVLREGAETVVFFWGLAASLPPVDLLIGGAGALAVLTVLGVLMIGFSKRLPLQWFFPLATALIYFLAVKILGQSLGSLEAAGWLSATPLGFAGPLDAVGFLPTWETAVPQVLLALTLGALMVRTLAKKRSP